MFWTVFPSPALTNSMVPFPVWNKATVLPSPIVIALTTPVLVANISTKNTFVLYDPIVIKAINCSFVDRGRRANTNDGRVIVWRSHCRDRSGETKFTYGFSEKGFGLPHPDGSASGIGISHHNVNIFVVSGVDGTLVLGEIGRIHGTVDCD